MKKLVIGIIVIIFMFAICASLESSLTPDGSTPQTDALLNGTINGITEGFNQLKDGISTMFNDIFEKEETVNTEIGEIAADELPEEVQECYKKYVNDNWQTTTEDFDDRTQAGAEYENREKLLPEATESGEKISYKEYDAQVTPKGSGRGTKRFVHGSDGSTYYTDDHYQTFKKVVN